MSGGADVIDARKLIRRAAKAACSFNPCNHINCNKSVSGCVNVDHEDVVPVLLLAFETVGAAEWMAAVQATAWRMNEEASRERI